MNKKNIWSGIAGFLFGASLLIAALLIAGPRVGQAVGWIARNGNSQNQPLAKETTLPPTTSPTPLLDETAGSKSALVESQQLRELYNAASPGVVSIYVNQTGVQSGSGAGSGFIYDQEGHIVTNNHVVRGADLIVVDFANGFQSTAELIGTDDDSDLAVIKVQQVPDDAHPLPLGTASSVDVGQPVVAIGNPFGLNTSMTLGITSAKGRTIPSGTTPFSIPEAIQVDAAVNPGNSGGPLLDLSGKVIGVNAQIASSGTRANAGVAFAIPVSTVKKVIPNLIEDGEHQWPWLGISGTSVNLFIQQANDLETQQGAYVVEVVPDSPAAHAGLQGGSELTSVSGVQAPVGGDVITAVNDEQINNFNDLLITTAIRSSSPSSWRPDRKTLRTWNDPPLKANSEEPIALLALFFFKGIRLRPGFPGAGRGHIPQRRARWCPQ